MEWNLHSNVCDVLALGPRTAGKLATIEIRTVTELLAARPQVAAARISEKLMTADTIAAWQRESQLLIAMPQLPPAAARLLAAAGFGTAHRLGLCSPTELLAAIETAQKKNVVAKNAAGWLAETTLPTVSEVGEWIHLARETKKSFAA